MICVFSGIICYVLYLKIHIRNVYPASIRLCTGLKLWQPCHAIDIPALICFMGIFYIRKQVQNGLFLFQVIQALFSPPFRADFLISL